MNMKRFLTLSLVMFFLASLSATAQTAYSGIKGGLNLSSLASDDGDYDDNMKIGFHAGFFSKMEISELVALQPELLYSLKGIKIDYDESAIADGSSKFNLHYIDLPVKLVLNFSDYIDLQFGPYVSYLVAADIDNDADIFDGIEVDGTDELDRDQFNKFDYGLTVGIGFDLDPLILGVNYNLGLNPVAKDDQLARDILGDAKNSTIMLSAGLKF